MSAGDSSEIPLRAARVLDAGPRVRYLVGGIEEPDEGIIDGGRRVMKSFDSAQFQGFDDPVVKACSYRYSRLAGSHPTVS
jgi:hypothetical protein